MNTFSFTDTGVIVNGVAIDGLEMIQETIKDGKSTLTLTFPAEYVEYSDKKED